MEQKTAQQKAEERKIRFGDRVTIEQKRHGVSNEHYTHRVVVGQEGGQTSFSVPVPVQSPATHQPHDGMREVVACMVEGVGLSEVMYYRIEDVRLIEVEPRDRLLQELVGLLEQWNDKTSGNSILSEETEAALAKAKELGIEPSNQK